MFLGAQPPVSRQRARLIDLNLVPAEYRRPQLSLVTAGLGLLLVGCLLLLYAVFYARTYRTEEVDALTSRVAQGQSAVQAATGNPTVVAQRLQFRAMRDDVQSLKQRQINWGDVFQVIGDNPKSIVVKSVGQAGFGVTVTGSAVDASAAARYLQQLKDSGLFVNASLQVNPSSNPAQFASPSPTPPPVATPPGQPTPGAPAIAAVPTQPPSTPTGPASGLPQPIYQPPAQQPPSQPSTGSRNNQPVYVPPSAPSASPIRKPSPSAVVATPSATTPSATTPTVKTTTTPTSTPTPAFDFIVQSKQQVAASNPNAGVTDIQGKIVDASGNLVPGFQVEIDSEIGGAWSAQSLPNKEDGTFDFAVTHGKFKVFVIGGSSQQATDLFTGADGTPGAYGYQIVFEKTFSGTTPVDAGTGTPTFTPTSTPSPTLTPISLGANIANLGCASAYQVVNGTAKPLPNGNNPNLATDGNTGTEWNAGMAPNSGTQIIWQWSLPEPGQANPCNSPGLADSADQINGLELIADQNPAGPTYHELWLFSDEGCQTNLSTTNAPWITWQQSTSAGSVLPVTTTNIAVRCVIIRTLQDPSYVAWEEVQIYQAVAPPNGFPTATATPTAIGPTPTETATPTASAIPSATATSTASPTVTSTPPATATSTASPTATPPSPTPILPLYSGINVAPCGVASATSAGAPTLTPTATPTGTTVPSPSGCSQSQAVPYSAAAAIDNNLGTFWVPVQPGGTPVSDPQSLTVQLPPSSLYNPSLGSTDSIGDVRIVVRASGQSYEQFTVTITGDTVYSCTLTPTNPTGSSTPTASATNFTDYSQIECKPPSPVVRATRVDILLQSANPSGEDGSYGIREVQIWKPASTASGIPIVAHSTSTNTATLPTSGAPTPSPTNTEMASVTNIATASSTPTPCGSCAPSATHAATMTPAQTPTFTSTAVPTSTTAPSTPATNNVRIGSKTVDLFGLQLPFGLGRGPGADFVPPATPSTTAISPPPPPPGAIQYVPTVVTTPAVVQPGTVPSGEAAATPGLKPGQPTSGTFPTPLAQDTSGPVDFTIVLELAPGKGYP